LENKFAPQPELESEPTESNNELESQNLKQHLPLDNNHQSPRNWSPSTSTFVPAGAG